MTTTDQIQKHITLRAPLSKVWKAIATPAQFGEWFGVRFEVDTFEPSAVVRGRFLSEKYADLQWEMIIDRVQPQSLFSFRWHPYAMDKNVDYSMEERTLIRFELKETAGGTELTITESGFDKVPLARRAEAFRMNSMGWGMKAEDLQRYVETQ